jgi:branched-subunit amino acid aminotransferase/4-amino-4-deoxychorismate lyase
LKKSRKLKLKKSVTTQWRDGRLIDEKDSAAVRPADSIRASEPSCYTSARVTAGRAHHGDHHARRLQRDANAIGLGPFDPLLVFRAFEELGGAVFGDESGIVRIEAQRSAHGAGVSLLATTRPLGPESDSWSAITSPIGHHGPSVHSGAKLTQQKAYEEARAASRKSAVDEALLFDGSGHLVEGARSNLLIVDRAGTLATPDLALGAVAGIALEILSACVAELGVATFDKSDVINARELIAVNAVRGAISITELDGRNIGGGASGPWAKRLHRLLADTP